MDVRSFETNGIKISAIEHPGDGPLLLLFPGLTANARFFDDVVQRMEGRLNVLALDLRGRGQSDKPATGYRMEDHAADVLGILDQLGLDSVAIGGHSFGGLLTYFIAANHAERVERCVVLDAPAIVDPGILDQIKPALNRLGTELPSFDEYLTAAKSAPYYDDWWDPAIEEYFRADVERVPGGGVRSRSRPEHIRQAVQGTLDVDWPKLVSNVPQPTLVVRARGNFGPPGSPPILGSRAAAETLSLLADGQLLEIDGNHMTGFFGPPTQLLADTVTRFLAT